MAEPITTVGVSAIAAYLGKDGISKILGPTAEYIGGELKEFTKRRIENIGNIFKSAEKKLGSQLDRPGSVSPKVLKSIINDGSYSNEGLAIEYFGGILASSRGDSSIDDRGARISRKVDNLSVYQLHAHYLLYSTLAKTFKASEASVLKYEEREKLYIYTPISAFKRTFNLEKIDWSNPQIFHHIFHGLANDGLIGNRWGFGDPEHIKAYAPNLEFSEAGIIYQPTVSGVELFLWAFGLGKEPLDYIFSEHFESDVEGLEGLLEGSFRIK
ncbi:hypothetical protein [Shewanella cyperi]|uniref:hypothetical protein n=1 Tax=Shewanella cyperi TaxID=2814292 RepID=UPI001A952CA4|nr:hypothetical protein [Shewanella cyperi]QSX41365.1 hypothetical protein JYB84_02705 [Shewanella cyperi]